MAGNGPSILVAASDGRERERIATTIGDAGFAVIATAKLAGALSALAARDITAIVLAPQAHDPVALVEEARRRKPGLPAVLVLPRAALRPPEMAAVTIVRRPLDPRQVLGCLFELVLRDPGAGAWRHSRAAELGIAAAQLACLDSRRITAAAAGHDCLERQLTRQIGHVREVYRHLADWNNHC